MIVPLLYSVNSYSNLKLTSIKTFALYYVWLFDNVVSHGICRVYWRTVGTVIQCLHSPKVGLSFNIYLFVILTLECSPPPWPSRPLHKWASSYQPLETPALDDPYGVLVNPYLIWFSPVVYSSRRLTCHIPKYMTYGAVMLPMRAAEEHIPMPMFLRTVG